MEVGLTVVGEEVRINGTQERSEFQFALIPRAYEEKRACNSQCILCSRQKTDESAGYTIFSQPPIRK